MDDHLTDEIANEPHLPTRNRAVAWVTLAVLGAAAVGGGVYAATSGSSAGPVSAAGQLAAATSAPATPNASPSTPEKDQGGRRGPGVLGPMGGRFGGPGVGGLAGPGLGGRVLHGESTVQTKDGTQVVDTQAGTISAIDTSKKTITVTSTDKVAFTYVLDSTTRILDFTATAAAGAPTSPPATRPAARPTATISDLKVGDTVEVVAIRTGDTRTAKSVVDGKPTAKLLPRGPRFKNGPQGVNPSPSASATGASA